MDLGEWLGYALAAARLADALLELRERWDDAEETQPDPAPQEAGAHQEAEVHAMSSRELKVTITVLPGKTSQTMRVRAAGRRGPLLLGKVRRVEFHQTLTSAGTEQLYVSELLTLAQALVLS